MNSRERTNIRALGILQILLAPLWLLGAYLFWEFAQRETNIGIRATLAPSYYGLAGLTLLFSGLGIMSRKKWMLPFMLAAGILQLPAIPLGTALGIWTLMIYAKLSKRVKQRNQRAKAIS